MGLLGSIFGWDQSMAAVNAVLAEHLLMTSDTNTRLKIAREVVSIVRSVFPRMTTDLVLSDLNRKSRTVQMNFVALACDNLGISPPGRNTWTRFSNPNHAGGQVDRLHIDSAIESVLKQDHISVEWPDDSAHVDFEKMIEGGVFSDV